MPAPSAMRQATIAAAVPDRSRRRPLRDSAKAIALIALAAALMALAGAVLGQGAPRFPALSGRVVDEAGLLPAADRAEIETSLAELEAKSTDQVVVVTLTSLQGYAIEDFGYRLGRHWGVGQQGKDNGVLIIVAPNDRKVRIEVGRGLEPQLTDTLSALIVQNALLPAIRRGDFPAGIKAAVRDVKDVLLGDAEAVRQRAAGGRGASEIDWEAVVVLAIWLAVVAFIVYRHYRQMQRVPQSANARRKRRRSRYGDPDVIALPGGWGGSGSWGSGSGGSSRGSSGGGWSGGGGSFGGGGASGSW